MSDRYTAGLVPPHIAALMSPADRKATGERTIEDLQGAYESGLEAGLQKLCEQELSRRGIEHLHLSPKAREKKGWPDLTFTLKLTTNGAQAIPMAVELKTATGRLSDDQLDRLTKMQRNGTCVRIIRSYDAFCALLDGKLTEGEGI